MPDPKPERILYQRDLSPPSNSVTILAEMLGVDITTREVNLLNMEHKGEEYKKINPMGTIPTLSDGGYIISESHAIMKYLLEVYGTEDQKEELYPSDPKTRGLVDQCMFFDAGVLFVRLKEISLGAVFHGDKRPTDKQKQGVEDAYFVLESYLRGAGGTHLAGRRLTLADVCAATTTNALLVSHALDEEKFPLTVAWLARMNNHPLFKKINAPGVAGYAAVMNACWDKNEASA